jgi:hypothetical protein
MNIAMWAGAIILTSSLLLCVSRPESKVDYSTYCTTRSGRNLCRLSHQRTYKARRSENHPSAPPTLHRWCHERKSNIYPACYRPIFLLTAKQIKNSSIKIMHLHEAVQCRYKDCPTLQGWAPNSRARCKQRHQHCNSWNELSFIRQQHRPSTVPSVLTSSTPTNNTRATSGTNQPLATTPRCISGTSQFNLVRSFLINTTAVLLPFAPFWFCCHLFCQSINGKMFSRCPI